MTASTNYTPISYTANDYSSLRGLKGITDEQIEIHLKLYNGYVSRTNALFAKVAAMANAGQTGDSSYQELKRRAGWEWNGMRLHEYYFDNLTPGGTAMNDAFAKAVSERFGSVEAWKDDLLGVAKSPGIGWAITYLDRKSGQIWNHWVTEHECGHPAGAEPLLVLDVFEHAFSVYRKPTDRGPYLGDFFDNVNWDVVAGRL
ncbi:MAG: superoxide dismutase [Myxococcales bacterium]|nr:superoxide dismutase [Myxococcales bacterium]MCB9567914.1 superoxide dismutase [Myxococcales bacterium]MCB9700360.1 superoxide dismutase [Myxococcales bacterium]